jgi:hypothetical protein
MIFLGHILDSVGWPNFIHMTETGVSCGGRGYLLWLGVLAAGFCI